MLADVTQVSQKSPKYTLNQPTPPCRTDESVIAKAIAPTTPTSDTPRASLRRPNAFAASCSGARQVPLRRALLTTPKMAAAKMMSQTRTSEGSNLFEETGTPAAGRFSY